MQVWIQDYISTSNKWLHYPPQAKQQISKYQQAMQRDSKDPNQTINLLPSYLRMSFSSEALFFYKHLKFPFKINKTNETAAPLLLAKRTALLPQTCLPSQTSPLWKYLSDLHPKAPSLSHPLLLSARKQQSKKAPLPLTVCCS